MSLASHKVTRIGQIGEHRKAHLYRHTRRPLDRGFRPDASADVERPFKAAMPAFERAFFSYSAEAAVHAVRAHP